MSVYVGSLCVFPSLDRSREDEIFSTDLYYKFAAFIPLLRLTRAGLLDDL
jgi:hypothetical protein